MLWKAAVSTSVGMISPLHSRAQSTKKAVVPAIFISQRDTCFFIFLFTYIQQQIFKPQTNKIAKERNL